MLQLSSLAAVQQINVKAAEIYRHKQELYLGIMFYRNQNYCHDFEHFLNEIHDVIAGYQSAC